MQVGDVVNMTHWTHFQPNIQASYRAPKGRVGVFLLLGDADKKAPETFDAVGAIRALGWVPGTEIDEVDDMLAATSLEFGERLEALQKERDTLRAQLAEAVGIIGKWKSTFGEAMARRASLYVETDAFLSATAKPEDAP